jgi:3' terminal RNA ribose 2'-O-methyltransferase Hen1
MLLTITSTTAPAADLGYLLHKNPARSQVFELTFGEAHVFYSEASAERCTAALLLEVDPVDLVRRRRGPAGEGRALEQYVNDRPYVASSFLSVALAEVFGSALSGRSKERPELVVRELSLEAKLAVVPCRADAGLLRRLFEPLGYELDVTRLELDEQNAAWGPSRYFSLTLRGTKRLSELLAHLYVLVPVLDDDKHYWVGDDEVEKLVRHGQGWLGTHPERELIAARYLKHQRGLLRDALERLVAEESPALDELAAAPELATPELEKRKSLNDERVGAVLGVLRQREAKRVIDLGCGEGRLLRALFEQSEFAAIAGMDVSHRALELASERLHLERLSERARSRIELFQSSLTYRDRRFSGWDAAVLVEVIEHLDPARLAACERVVFEFARPGTVVVTTPNAEYNVKFEQSPSGRLRHHDHRFEWSRAEFRAWADAIAVRFGYAVQFVPVGPEDAVVGAPTQMAVFAR